VKTYYFIRHGASESDVGAVRLDEFDRDMQTWTDWALSEKGKRQATEVGQKLLELGVECIFSSSLQRTIRTAKIASETSGIPYKGQWQELNEILLGRLSAGLNPTGQPYPENRVLKGLKQPLWPLFYRSLSILYILLWRAGKTTGGETRDQINNRIQAVFDRLEETDANRIAVVGHGYWIFFMTRFIVRSRASSLPHTASRGWIGNGSFTKVCHEDEKLRLKYFAMPFSKVTV